MTKSKEILDTTKIMKSQRQSKNLKRILTSSTFRENTAQGVTKCKNKRCGVCDIIIEGKLYTFKSLKTKLRINKNKSCNPNVTNVKKYTLDQHKLSIPGYHLIGAILKYQKIEN